VKIDHEAKTITFRQSWLNNYFNCPEQVRRLMLEPDEDQSSDAAILGTGVHAYAELRLLGEDRVVATAAAFNALDHEFSLPHRIVQMSEDKVYSFIPAMLASFERDLLPQVERGGECEVEFKLLLGEWNGWTIYVSGTIDYVAPSGDLWDWKTAGRKYEKWEKERWAIQPTIYSFAAVTLGKSEYPVRWRYGIVLKSPVKRPETQVVEFYRREGHIEWVTHQIYSILETHRFDIDLQENCGGTLASPLVPWVKNDQHALCSEKWCPFWSTCKGQFVV
jgi:hypothetical protein